MSNGIVKELRSRRRMLAQAVALGLGAGFCSSLSPANCSMSSILPLMPDLKTLHEQVIARLVAAFSQNQLQRKDGYSYTVDLAQLFICLAQAGVRDICDALRAHSVARLINHDPRDWYCQNFVAWRYRPGEPIDASGTTEALRLARALWISAQVFQRPEDVQTARRILHGYARHATTDQGVWIIRNYFTYKTRAFATNSFLVDYDADFVSEVADATHDPDLADVARRSYEVVRDAVTPCGLLYDLVQPDLKTLYPMLNVHTFSPNDVVGLTGCGTTALGVARGAPRIGRHLLQFAMKRFADLRRYYYGRGGEPVDASVASIFEYTTLARLAATLGDEAAAARIVDRALVDWQWMAERHSSLDIFLLTELCQALHALIGIRGIA